MIVQELFSVLGLKIDEKSWAAGNKFLGAVKAGFAGVVAGLGVSKVAHWVEEVAAMGANADDTSQALGVTTEAITELGHAAEVGGSSAGAITGGLRRLAMAMDQVKKGEGPAVDALNKLGLSADDFKGKALDENLEIVADKFKAMPDGIAKTNLAMGIFGKSGADLIPFLNNGADGIQELRQEAVDLGLSLSGETAKNLADFEDDTKRLGATWQGIKIQVVSSLLPALSGLVEHLKEWLAANRELIQKGLSTVITVATYAVKAFATALEYALKFLSVLAEDSSVMNGVLIALGAAMAYFAVTAVAAWIAAAAPIIAFIALVTAVYVGVAKLIENWDAVKEAGASAWEWIKKRAEDFVHLLLKLPALLLAIALWPAVALGMLVKHWDKVKEAGARAWAFLRDKGIDFLHFIQGLPDKILDVFKQIGEGIIDALGAAFDWVIAKAKSAAGEIWDNIKDIPVIGSVASGAESLFGSVGGSGLPGMAGGIEGAQAQMAGVVGGDVVSSAEQAVARNQEVIAASGSGGGGTTTIGDINMTVNAAPGMDAEQLAELAASKADEKRKQQYADTWDNLKGGRR